VWLQIKLSVLDDKHDSWQRLHIVEIVRASRKGSPLLNCLSCNSPCISIVRASRRPVLCDIFHWKYYVPETLNLPNQDSSVSRGTNSIWDFGSIWICTEELELEFGFHLQISPFLDLRRRRSESKIVWLVLFNTQPRRSFWLCFFYFFSTCVSRRSATKDSRWNATELSRVGEKAELSRWLLTCACCRSQKDQATIKFSWVGSCVTCGTRQLGKPLRRCAPVDLGGVEFSVDLVVQFVRISLHFDRRVSRKESPLLYNGLTMSQQRECLTMSQQRECLTVESHMTITPSLEQ